MVGPVDADVEVQRHRRFTDHQRRGAEVDLGQLAQAEQGSRAHRRDDHRLDVLGLVTTLLHQRAQPDPVFVGGPAVVGRPPPGAQRRFPVHEGEDDVGVSGSMASNMALSNFCVINARLLARDAQAEAEAEA